MKIVVTIVGKDRVGIIAMVSNILAENNVNILNINQNIMGGFFNMVMIAEMNEMTKKDEISFTESFLFLIFVSLFLLFI